MAMANGSWFKQPEKWMLATTNMVRVLPVLCLRVKAKGPKGCRAWVRAWPEFSAVQMDAATWCVASLSFLHMSLTGHEHVPGSAWKRGPPALQQLRGRLSPCPTGPPRNPYPSPSSPAAPHRAHPWGTRSQPSRAGPPLPLQVGLLTLLCPVGGCVCRCIQALSKVFGPACRTHASSHGVPSGFTFSGCCSGQQMRWKRWAEGPLSRKLTAPNMHHASPPPACEHTCAQASVGSPKLLPSSLRFCLSTISHLLLMQLTKTAFQTAGVDPSKPYAAIHLRLHGMVRKKRSCSAMCYAVAGCVSSSHGHPTPHAFHWMCCALDWIQTLSTDARMPVVRITVIR